MSNRDKKMASMILSEEEKRYFRALLSWEPRDLEELVRRRTVPKQPIAGEFRVLLLGSKGCGKTAILTRFCKGSFTGEGQPPNPEYERGCRRRIEIKGQTYLVDALEMAPSKVSEGQYLRHAVAITEAVVLIYDVRSRDSFVLAQELHRRVEEALALDNRQHYGLVLVGNKADGGDGAEEAGHRMVTEGEGYELASNFGRGRTRCGFRETSARTGEGVEGLFALLGAELLRLRRLAQQQQQRRRQEQQADETEKAAAAAANGNRRDKWSRKKTTGWRVWARNRFRRASEDAAEKGCRRMRPASVSQDARVA